MTLKAGLFAVHKPAGPTANDIVSIVRSRLSKYTCTKVKLGHGGKQALSADRL